MQAQLVFAFPWNTDVATALNAVAEHFGATVSINGAAPVVPAHIKQAVENYAAGVEPSAAVAFGGLVNGSAGNVPATSAHAHSSADVATLPIAHVAQQDISATTPPASLAHVPQHVNGAPAHAASVATANHVANVEFDSTGLPWDERIHSGNKTKNPGGEWRTKKGADKGLIASVTAELRAAVGNANIATVAGSVAVAAHAAPINSPVSVDPVVKRQQALDFAHAEAIRVCGASPISDTVLQGLLNGKPATLAPHEADWYNAYFAKRNAAFVEYMQRPNVASASQDASASAPMTGGEAAAQAATASGTGVFQTGAGGTVAPVTVAPQGELDATGLPHDARIHVGAKLKDADGLWLQRFDVTGETKLAVMAELRAALAGNAAAQASNGAPAPASTPVAPTPPVVPVVSAADAGTEFPKLMQWIVANQIAGRIGPSAGPDAAKAMGFADANGNGALAMMAGDTGKMYYPYIVQMLQGQGAV
jgi:hypothetical protein